MKISDLTDGELFATRLKIVYFGIDHNDEPAGEIEHDKITQEILSRNLRNEASSQLYDVGNAHMRQGNYEAALQAYEEAIEISPRYLDAYTNLGNCLFTLGRLQEAHDILKKGAEFGYTFDLAFNLGSYLVKLGKPSEGYEMLQKAANAKLGYMIPELAAETLCAIMDETTSPSKFSIELQGGEQGQSACQKSSKANPEVQPKAERRRFSAEYKRRMVAKRSSVSMAS